MGGPVDFTIYRFGNFVLDLGRGALLSAEGTELPLRPKSFALLRLLVENAGSLVAREVIMEALWPNIFVTDDNITQCVLDIRRMLGAAAPQLLRTLPRRGYLFAATVTAERMPRFSALPRASGASGGVAQSHKAERRLPAAADTEFSRAGVLVGPRSRDRPSIAVLAFGDLGQDRQQDYFSDGVADDIITELSRNHALFVVARASSFSYKGRAVGVKQIASELGVRYVVDGSVRRDSNRLRITAQLVDAESGDHIWADRFDRDFTDLFAVQDQITRAIVGAIDPAISQVERQRAMRKTPEGLSGWEAWQRALWYWSKGSELSVRRHFLQLAIALDPHFAPPHAMMVWLYLSEGTRGEGRSLREALGPAEAEARTALDLDPDSSITHAALAWVFAHQGEREAALEEADLAITLNPNDPQGYLIKGHVLSLSGEPVRGREALTTALWLDPRGPTAPAVMHNRAVGCYLERDYGAAEVSTRRSIRVYPEHPRPYVWLTAALGQLGRADEAQLALHAATALAPNYLKYKTESRAPYMRPQDHEHLLEGLRKAGWTLR